MIIDGRRLYPGLIGFDGELARSAGPHRSNEAERYQEDSQGCNQAEDADGFRLVLRQREDDQKRDQRQENDGIE